MMDFAVNQNCGQMTTAERELLYNTVVGCRPAIAFEVGTWEGGGSTYFISGALVDNNYGILYTIERDLVAHQRAKDNFFLWPQHAQHSILFNGESQIIFPPILRSLGQADFVFLDGENDPESTVRDYQMFLPYMFAGSMLACHDWTAPKMERLKQIVGSAFKQVDAVDSLVTFERRVIQ